MDGQTAFVPADDRRAVVGIAIEAAKRLATELSRPSKIRLTPEGGAMIDGELAEYLVDGIHRLFPNDGIICEDAPPYEGTSGRSFVIDPHDGTDGALQGLKGSSVSVGLVSEGVHLLGVVSVPTLPEELGLESLVVSWAAGGAVTATTGPRYERVMDRTKRPSDILLVGANLGPDRLAENEACAAPARIVGCTSLATRLALASIGFASVAVSLYSGTADWDFCAGQALLRGAGGDLVDHDGEIVCWKGIRSESKQRFGLFGSLSLEDARDMANRYKPMTEKRRTRHAQNQRRNAPRA